MDSDYCCVPQHELAEFFRSAAVGVVLVERTAKGDKWRIAVGVKIGGGEMMLKYGLQLKSGGEREFRTLEAVTNLIKEVGGSRFTVTL